MAHFTGLGYCQCHIGLIHNNTHVNNNTGHIRHCHWPILVFIAVIAIGHWMPIILIHNNIWQLMSHCHYNTYCHFNIRLSISLFPIWMVTLIIVNNGLQYFIISISIIILSSLSLIVISLSLGHFHWFTSFSSLLSVIYWIISFSQYQPSITMNKSVINIITGITSSTNHHHQWISSNIDHQQSQYLQQYHQY